MILDGKATHEQVRHHNQRLVLRAVVDGTADNRAALSQVTGLTKPTVSRLVAELIDDGLLAETGFGLSSEGGGKRPRLLTFLPDARQVIGIAIEKTRISGVLTNLAAKVIAEHTADLFDNDPDTALTVIDEVINGLIAQQGAPLLAVGIGISAMVNVHDGIIIYSPDVAWRKFPISAALSPRLNMPVYLAT